jgi:hypothetical protein
MSQQIYRADTTDYTTYLTYALDFMKIAEKIVENALEKTDEANKPFISLHYRQILTALGSLYMALYKEDTSEYYLLKAINYNVIKTPEKINLKQRGGSSVIDDKRNRIVSGVGSHCIQRVGNDYIYFTEPNCDMFLLKLNQNKTEEAYEWYDKALQVSLIEKGNDTSGSPFIKSLFKVFKNIDKERLLKLRAKYFPDAEKVE